jgi:hypothetical protein
MRRRSGASLEAFGIRALIEALMRRFLGAMHVEEMCHPIGPLSAKFGCFAALQILRTRFVAKSR